MSNTLIVGEKVRIIDCLRQENDMLREHLANAHTALLAINNIWPPLGFTPQCEAIVRCLYKNYPRIIPHEVLLTAMYAHRPECDWADSKILSVQVCRIRKNLLPKSIETMWGRGFRLTELGRDYITSLLEQL
jgi:DNA-binding response OmpR family regulator